jgi:hypothetical protein
MKRIILFAIAALSLAGCAAVGNPATPAQKLYATLGAYDAALTGANAYAAQPGASPAVIHKLSQGAQAAKPAVDAARAYPACSGGAASVTVGGTAVPCLAFDFSTAGILKDVAALQAAIVTLQKRN